MITRFLEWLIGANWRTSLAAAGSSFTFLLTIVAGLPYEFGDLAAIFPTNWKGRIAIAAAIATAILKFIQGHVSKDAVVAGNGSGFKPNTVNDGSVVGHIVKTIAILLIPAVLFTGCVGTGPNGRFTPADAAATIRNADDAARVADHLLQLAKEARAEAEKFKAVEAAP